MRRRIYRHIRKVIYDDGVSTTGIFWIFIAHTILAAFFNEAAAFLPSLFFISWWLYRILRNIRDNYIMDTLSILTEEKIRSTAEPQRLKLRKLLRNEFINKNYRYEYTTFLSDKFRFTNDKLYGGLFSKRKENFPEKWEDTKKLSIYFPILKKNYHLGREFKNIMSRGNFLNINITSKYGNGLSDVILTIKDVAYWEHDTLSYSTDISKPRIYLAKVNFNEFSSDYKEKNGNYVLITSNELCLFDVFTD